MNLFALAALIGVVLPATVIPLVLQEHWRNPVKAGAAFLLCIAAAAVTVWTRGQFAGWTTATLKTFLDVLGPVVAGAFGSYAGLWSNFSSIKALQKVTTFATAAVSMWHQLTPAERELAASAFLANRLAASVPIQLSTTSAVVTSTSPSIPSQPQAPPTT